MTDRTAQARDAYWNTHPHTNGPALDMDTLRFGVEWADANPQPHTITTSAHGKLVESLIGGTVGDHIGGLASLDHLDAEGIVESILRDLGIEVTDDE